MTEQLLLVTFCNQTASPRHSGALLALDADGCTWLDGIHPEILEPDSFGIAGVCLVDGDLILATQSAAPSLIRYDPVTRQVKASRDLTPCRDLHSVVYHAGMLYVVSTGTNEIYEVPLGDDGFGAPRVYWRYPGQDYDRDLVHLNGLTTCADGLIASCFGPRQADGAWGSNGAVFRLDPYQVIQDGLSQPHTPYCVGDRLFLAESRGHKVYLRHRDEHGAWAMEGSVDVGGYARGLACNDDILWVGVSATRRISRSKGTRNQGLDADHGAELVWIDLNTDTVSGRRALGGLGDEIYDLLIVETAGPVGSTLNALTQRIGGMQETVDTVRAQHSDACRRFDSLVQTLLDEQANRMRLTRDFDALVQTLLVEQATRMQFGQERDAQRAAVQALQQSLALEEAYSAKLAQQLLILVQSRLWRAAQSLRRMARRIPYVPDFSRPILPSSAPVDAPADPPPETG